MDLPKIADIVIVGGGVMGTSLAYHLARRGAGKIVLLEREEFLGSGATGRCAGGIRHQFSTEVNIRLSIASIAMLERFAEEMGQEIGLNQCGYLLLAQTEEEMAAFRAAVELQHHLGVMTAWLDPQDIEKYLQATTEGKFQPLVNTAGVLAGTFYQRDGLCNPNSVVQGYARQATRLGVKVLTGVEVRGISVRHGMIQSVQTSQGWIDTPVVVNAAGPWSALVGQMAGVDIPMVPIRRQISVTGPIPGLTQAFPFTIFFKDNLYFHWETGGILTGKSNIHQAPGFDISVDPEWRMVALEAAMARMPALEDAQIIADWAGLYEVTPDAHPILGPAAEVAGFYMMTGFSGHGFMHGPISGLVMSEWILDGAPRTVDVRSLTLERFAQGLGIPEHNVI
ncbi:MAG: FAD-binding oxidoreductase [Chloroflexi bacterium]|nr:FAD-binding oxidoreductase [Chloroflexota bacterium]